MTHAILLTLFILASTSVLLLLGLVLIPRLVSSDKSEAHLRFERLDVGDVDDDTP